VGLEKRSCTCLRFQDTDISCRHPVVLIHRLPNAPADFQPAYQVLVKREAEVEAIMLSVGVGRYHCVAYCQTLAMWACPEISESLKP
jgi:hypothetical protein